ncbi:Intracellular protein transport protein USO1 [Candida viswanathii]|uniref:Intracellular protein transport protein USO1 n=1 Tax=Candida viswanathii TaxID=5486 RepID=A0A367XSV6_9ASCO|nr:Intracellular protein transport protein USO1 [Candida viswanathii]
MEYLNNILGQLNQVQLVKRQFLPYAITYREAVVEHGLRPLIATFKKDIDNPQIIKPLLETLLILFIRGETGEDQTRGWISQQSPDALIQDQEILSQLIENLSEATDYHTKLYTIQLLEALASSRGSRTKEALLNIPTSMSTICLLLQDSNEPVRNEAILLLMALVNDNFNIQKLVAFENTLRDYPELLDEDGFPVAPPPIVWTDQRIQNMIIALEICRLLVSEDNELVIQNQDKLFQAGIHYILLKLVFSPLTETLSDQLHCSQLEMPSVGMQTSSLSSPRLTSRTWTIVTISDSNLR